MRRCKHCDLRMQEEKFPLSYIRKGRHYRRWECHKCLSLLAIERRAKMKDAVGLGQSFRDEGVRVVGWTTTTRNLHKGISGEMT